MKTETFQRGAHYIKGTDNPSSKANDAREITRVLLRLPQVKAKVPYSRSTIYLKIQRGEFPAPISMGGNAVAWIESEVDQWISQRIATSRDRVQPSE